MKKRINSRDKGLGFEREVVKIFQANGFDSKRIPLFGAGGNAFNDITAGGMQFECKRLAQEPSKFLQDAFDKCVERGGEGVIFRADRGKIKLLIELDTLFEILEAQTKTIVKEVNVFQGEPPF